jgi:hypothetical protein
MRRIRPTKERYRPVLEALETRCLPTVLTVTTTADSVAGSLRFAISAAHNGDTIVFALPKFSAIKLSFGDLVIDKNITVAGPGPAQLTVQAGVASRVFDIGFNNGNAAVAISGLFITGGSISEGAGVSNKATLTMNNCFVEDNNITSGEGGGGIFNQGTMKLINTTVSFNTVNENAGLANAGGIFNEGSMTLIDSMVANNSLSGTTFGFGGGIYNAGGLGLFDSTIGFNEITATPDNAEGGGIYNAGTLGMVGTTVQGNSAAGGSGAGIANISTATLINCTVASNTVGAVGFGAGIIDESGAAMTVDNCTIAANSAGTGIGGGLFIQNSTTFTLENTIVANNIQTGMFPGDIGGDLTTAFNNLIGNGSGTNIGNGTNGNIVAVDPKLGPLQNNGGPTQTMALVPGSPAIDAGDDAFVTSTTDQRGLPRIFGTAVDMGAFESQVRPILVAAAGPGAAPEIKVYDAGTGALLRDFDAYDPHFLGGVRVALGDVNGDGIPDIITAPGPGGGPDIRVFDGATGGRIEEFFSYDPHFQAGVFVAAGDVNGDGKTDIITGPDEFSGPDVRVFYAGNVSGKPDKELLAYAQGFTGGVRVASADLNADGKADIITAPGPSGSPDVRIFSGTTLTKIGEFLAYAIQFTGGVFVAAGDVNGDKVPDIITGAGAGGGPEVRAFDGLGAGAGNPTPTVLDDFFAYSPMFSGGVQVAATALNADGTADIITGAGPGGGPHVRLFDGKTAQQLQQNAVGSFFPFDPSFTGGVFVGGL